MERGWKPMVEISPNCPRCASSNTKFCYYNNYSLTQPRYFCKGCRRYWTKGGSLRNIPVGGGCRKNRRSTIKPLTLTPSPSNPKFHPSNDINCLGNHHGLPDSDRLPSIDLAVVYANFVNQKPDTPGAFPTCNTANSNAADQFSVSGGVVGCGNFCEFPMQECELGANDYQVGVDNSEVVGAVARELQLPPLPGEDMVGGWPNSMIMVNNNHHRLQATRMEMFGMETQDPNLLSGNNWSPIDLSTYDTFSRA